MNLDNHLLNILELFVQPKVGKFDQILLSNLYDECLLDIFGAVENYVFTLCDNLEILGVEESDNSAILTSEAKLMLDEGRDISEGDDGL